jgi:hypothetical protein
MSQVPWSWILLKQSSNVWKIISLNQNFPLTAWENVLLCLKKPKQRGRGVRQLPLLPSLKTSEAMVQVVPGTVDLLLIVKPKLPNFQTIIPLSAAGMLLPLHSIARLEDILGHSTTLARVSMRALQQSRMHQLMVSPTLKALPQSLSNPTITLKAPVQFLNNSTHSQRRTWVLPVSVPVVLMEARPVMGHMITALLHPLLTNLHPTLNKMGET